MQFLTRNEVLVAVNLWAGSFCLTSWHDQGPWKLWRVANTKDRLLICTFCCHITATLNWNKKNCWPNDFGHVWCKKWLKQIKYPDGVKGMSVGSELSTCTIGSGTRIGRKSGFLLTSIMSPWITIFRELVCAEITSLSSSNWNRGTYALSGPLGIFASGSGRGIVLGFQTSTLSFEVGGGGIRKEFRPSSTSLGGYIAMYSCCNGRATIGELETGVVATHSTTDTTLVGFTSWVNGHPFVKSGKKYQLQMRLATVLDLRPPDATPWRCDFTLLYTSFFFSFKLIFVCVSFIFLSLTQQARPWSRWCVAANQKKVKAQSRRSTKTTG